MKTPEENRAYERERSHKKVLKKSLHLFHLTNELSNQSYKYKESIIDYDSPTGKAYIGLAKAPLMPSSTKIGFSGVKVQSDNRELLQCYECGDWYKSINSFHLKRHGHTAESYKKKFGLNLKTGLVSDIEGNRGADDMVRNTNVQRTRHLINSGNVSYYIERGKKKRAEKESSDERKNNLNTCDLQLQESIINYIKRFKRLPNYQSRREGLHITTICYRWGSLNKAFKELGLPTRVPYKWNTYVMPDHTIYKMNKEDPDEFYELMLECCECLK